MPLLQHADALVSAYAEQEHMVSSMVSSITPIFFFIPVPFSQNHPLSLPANTILAARSARIAITMPMFASRRLCFFFILSLRHTPMDLNLRACCAASKTPALLRCINIEKATVDESTATDFLTANLNSTKNSKGNCITAHTASKIPHNVLPWNSVLSFLFMILRLKACISVP